MLSGTYKRTEEHRKKLREKLKGNKNALGVIRSEETKKKLRKPKSEETKKRMKKWANSPEGKKVRKKAAKLGAKKRWEGHIKAKKKKKLYSKKYHKYPKGTTSLEKKRFTNMRYKARKRKAEGSHDFGEWELLKKQYGYTCPACGKSEPEIKLTEDHIIPLDKGGSDYIENIQPLCVSCNTRKHTKIIKFDPISKDLNHREKGA